MAQTVKRLPIMRETRVRFLGWEDPLEKEMAIHSSTIAWKVPWTEATVHGVAKSQTQLSNFTYLLTTQLQCRVLYLFPNPTINPYIMSAQAK